MEELEKKYVDLLINRCINFEQTKSLLIHCDFKEHTSFAEKLKAKANELGVMDVCINVNDLDEIHEYLKNTNLEDIKLNPLLDRSNWDIYSKKGAPIIFLNSTVPGLMDDIAPEKMKKWLEIRESTTKYYRDHVSTYTFPWCIVALPNERWAKKVFPNDMDAYNKLYMNIFKMCMIDREDPIKSWNDFIEENNRFKNRLNELKITKMHYTNSLGTDLYLEKDENSVWLNLDKDDAKGNQMIANMPSYEIFTIPNKYKTNGVVVSSKPLVLNGVIVEGLKFEFKDGEIVKVDATKGKEAVLNDLNNYPNAKYLGEIALVPYDSPISNTGIVFYTTLFDENSSCHLAWGNSYTSCIPDSENMTKEELDKLGANDSKTHIDFMVGTSDLTIEAETNEGTMLIFKDGNFNI